MTLLDAYALVALLLDEPAAEETESLLRSEDAAVSAVNLAEAVDVVQRVHGDSPAETRAILEPITATALRVRAVAEADAWRAAELRSRHYRRRSSELSLADCFLLAAARDGESIATSDPAVAAAARAEGVDVVALPDSAGRRP